MSAYESLAGSYDALTWDVPYEKIAQFFLRVCRRHGCKPVSVLDLACGTGSLAVLLAKQGLFVLGADCSEQMLTQASQKSAEMENAPYWILQKMQHLRLPQPVDAVCCCLDSVNYITRPAELQQALRRVFDALRPGGVFVFDINTPEKLQGLDGQVFLDENEDTYCVWRAAFSAKKRLCRYGIDLFRREGSTWRRSREEHTEYAYTVEELTQYLTAAGFSTVTVYGDRVLRAPEEHALRVWFAAKKES